MDITEATGNPELETLARRYAVAMDRRDEALLLGVFHPNATMQVEQPGHQTSILKGHKGIATALKAIRRWPRTFHLLAQGLYSVEGASATGEIYCTAHHFTSVQAGEGRDLVMYIRYQDRYRIDGNESWRITHRTVRVEATEDRPVLSD